MNLFYREKGEGEPLMILHGLWGASDNWLPVANRLAGHFKVILPDLRNHGQSPHSPGFNYEVMCEDIIELVNTLHPSVPLFFAGHSMGGKVLMHLLLKKPEIVRKAAIIDIAPAAYPIDNDSLHCQLIRFIETTDLTPYTNRTQLLAQAKKTLGSETYAQLAVKNIQKTEGCLQWKVNVDAIRNNMETLMNWETNSSVYGEDILFVKGGRSDYLNAANIEKTKKIFPAAHFKTIQDSSHWIHHEQPENLSKVIAEFFIPRS